MQYGHNFPPQRFRGTSLRYQQEKRSAVQKRKRKQIEQSLSQIQLCGITIPAKQLQQQKCGYIDRRSAHQNSYPRPERTWRRCSYTDTQSTELDTADFSAEKTYRNTVPQFMDETDSIKSEYHPAVPEKKYQGIEHKERIPYSESRTAKLYPIHLLSIIPIGSSINPSRLLSSFSSAISSPPRSGLKIFIPISAAAITMHTTACTAAESSARGSFSALLDRQSVQPHTSRLPLCSHLSYHHLLQGKRPLPKEYVHQQIFITFLTLIFQRLFSVVIIS